MSKQRVVSAAGGARRKGAQRAPKRDQPAPRRAPAPEQRQRDAERSSRKLIEAALDEFAEKGFDGARVQDIARRAGLNKQLISYYFGGKEGLYREIQRIWLEREATFTDPSLPLEELAARYLHDALAEPRLTRLILWRGLGTRPDQLTKENRGSTDLSSMRTRKERGELADDFDPASVRLFLMGAIAAPVAMPHLVWALFGIDPRSPEFEERYGEQLRAIVRRLAASR